MNQIKFINSTGCLMLKYGAELIDTIFYNQFEKDYLTIDELKKDASKLAEAHSIKEYALDLTEFVSKNEQALYIKNKLIESHELIQNMLDKYEYKNTFEQSDIKHLLMLADFLPLEASKLINKFDYIVKNIVDNGGAPLLKKALLAIKNEIEVVQK